MLLLPTLALLLVSAEPIGFEYRALQSCPDGAAFWRSVHARAPTAELALDETPNRNYRVTITRTSTGVHGRLSIQEEEVRYPDRVITGGDCHEVASALSLIVAMTLAPEQPEPAPEPKEVPVVKREVPPPIMVKEPSWRFAFGVDAAGVYGVVPDLEATFPIFVAAHHPQASFRLAFVYSASETNSARFNWTVGQLDACPLTWQRSDFILEPCVRLEVGVLSGEGLLVLDAAEESNVWAAVGAYGRVRYNASPPLFLEVALGGNIPILRHRFYLAPSETIHKVAPITAHGGLGIGLTFW